MSLENLDHLPGHHREASLGCDEKISCSNFPFPKKLKDPVKMKLGGLRTFLWMRSPRGRDSEDCILVKHRMN